MFPTFDQLQINYRDLSAFSWSRDGQIMEDKK